jgi:sulfite exporter TauE/SafE
VSTTLAATALLMGLAGGPHCAAMCGAACAAMGTVRARRSWWEFQAGRLAGYSLAGGIAASAMQSFAWLAAQAPALRPVWTLFHLAVLAWGLMLLAQARQPAWLADAGRTIWARVRPVAASRGGAFAAGTLWAFMPCGLLYSALLVASLSGGALEGALSMALFSAGSAVSLALAPWLLARLRATGDRIRRDLGTRAAGALLALAAIWGLWADAAHRIAVWCGLA